MIFLKQIQNRDFTRLHTDFTREKVKSTNQSNIYFWIIIIYDYQTIPSRKVWSLCEVLWSLISVKSVLTSCYSEVSEMHVKCED